MANPAKALPDNVPGEFFVDSTCIDCDTCRQLAPRVFGASGDCSIVESQPAAEDDERRALHALLACPTGSIGTRGPSRAKEVMDDFPLPVEGDVYYCGYTSPKSFGGSSYLVRHAGGNWLIDSPKYLPQLGKKFEAAGGLRYIFLTHRDDVADADRYARHFAAERIIHARERSSQPDAERLLDGDEAVQLAPGFVAIPTPGHTRGHVVLLFAGRYLFTGDHLWWDRDTGQLDASADYCWYSWSEQVQSMARLRDYQFEWVLPGHGDRVHLPAATMQQQLGQLVERMKRVTK
jgi:glyoxylase-like metal-dependent hydrolase (beta-lactamase superfamily II)/ferredoxin